MLKINIAQSSAGSCDLATVSLLVGSPSTEVFLSSDCLRVRLLITDLSLDGLTGKQSMPSLWEEGLIKSFYPASKSAHATSSPRSTRWRRVIGPAGWHDDLGGGFGFRAEGNSGALVEKYDFTFGRMLFLKIKINPYLVKKKYCMNWFYVA